MIQTQRALLVFAMLLAGSAIAAPIKPDIGLGVLQLGERERDFKKTYKEAEPNPVGETGECTLYDIDRAGIQRLMPWIDTDVVELVFAPETHNGVRESVLTSIAIGITPEQSVTLAAEYKKLLGPSVQLDEHDESWKFKDGSKIHITHYSDHSSITFMATEFLKC
jgi:hypothetical protein